MVFYTQSTIAVISGHDRQRERQTETETQREREKTGRQREKKKERQKDTEYQTDKRISYNVKHTLWLNHNLYNYSLLLTTVLCTCVQCVINGN